MKQLYKSTELISDGEFYDLTDFYAETIHGAGGKGGGGGHTPTEADDTLHSKQLVRVLLAIGAGEIAGIDDILLNGASISNYSDFVTWDWRPGTLNQTAITGFSEVEAPLAGGGGFPFVLTHASEPVYSVDGTKDAVRVTLTVQQLRQITSSGDRIGYSVAHSIYVRHHPAGGAPDSWQLAVTTVKTGKCTNPYSWDLRINKPAATQDNDTWEIRIVRDSADDSDDQHISPSAIQQIIEITESRLTYPGVALLALTIKDAERFNNRVPEIRILPRGMKFALPTNYNPVTRTYTGTWDTFFKSVKEYTNNLAWVIYYTLVDTKWGLGIPQADVDLGSFYLFAKHCDGQLPDGAGGYIYRHTIAVQFIERENVSTFLTHLLNLGNANFSNNDFGQLKIVWDGAGQVVTKLVANSNVIDGMFTYSSNSLESRVNLVNVTYSDENLQGDTNTATYFDQPLIDRYGLQTSDIALVGCNNEAQALYKAKWAIWVNSFDTEIIQFSQLFAGASYHIGELVKIMDSDNADSIAHHAVIESFTTGGGNTTITLDRTLTLANENFTVSYLLADGVTISDRAIPEKNGNFSQITLSSTTAALAVGTTILFSGQTIKPRLAKVIKISKEGHQYNITCLTHTEAKYAWYESPAVRNLPNSTGNFVNYSRFTVPPVTNITVEEVFISNGVTSSSKLAVAWKWDTVNAQKFKAKFKIAWRRDSDDLRVAANLSVSHFDIANPVPGVYEIFIWAINPFSGMYSTVVSNPYNFRIGAAASTLVAPINLQIEGTTPGNGNFDSRDAVIYWENPPSNLTKSDKLKDFIVEVVDFTTLAVKKAYIITPNEAQQGKFTLDFTTNIALFGTATRQFRIRVYCRDLIGDRSPYAELVCNNAAPAAPSFTVISGMESNFIHITPPADKDIVGYIVWRSTTSGFTPQDSDKVYDGGDLFPSFFAVTNTTFYFRVAAYDSFGKTNLNLASQGQSTTVGVNVDRFVYSGLKFTANSPSANKIAWNALTVSKNGAASTAVAAGNATWTTGTLYLCYDATVGAIISTTDLLIAVSKSQILGSYRGGTDFAGGDGSAFIDGGQILAKSVGANQIVSNSIIAEHLSTTSAVITNELQVGQGVINNAAIRDVIQSTNFSATNFTGWKINKAGKIISYGDLELYDGQGNAILTTGDSAALEWSKLINVPGGKGVNIMPARYATFNEAGLPPVAAFNGTALMASVGYFTNKSLRLEATAADGHVYLGTTGTDYNIKLTPNKKWIVSFFVNCSAGSSISGDVYIRTADTGTFYNQTFTSSPTANTWVRKSRVFDLTNDSSTLAILRLDCNTSGQIFRFDGIMIEELIGDVTTASAFHEPPNFQQSYTGALNATYGATIGSNLTGKFTAANITTFFANAAIGAAQIGSINLVGNFNVKSATAGQRMEMDSSSIKVYDSNGVLRVKLGNLA